MSPKRENILENMFLDLSYLLHKQRDNEEEEKFC